MEYKGEFKLAPIGYWLIIRADRDADPGRYRIIAFHSVSTQVRYLDANGVIQTASPGYNDATQRIVYVPPGNEDALPAKYWPGRG